MATEKKKTKGKVKAVEKKKNKAAGKKKEERSSSPTWKSFYVY